MISEEKQRIRKEMTERLRSMSAEEKARASEAIVAEVLRQPAWVQANRRFLFQPLPSEPDISPLLLTDGKTFVPSFSTDTLSFHAWPLRDETSPQGTVRPGADDLMILPGRAFAIGGQRLGRGAGWYDRYLGTLPHRPTLLGVGFACQILPSLPQEEHDVRLDLVLTEAGARA